MTWSYGESPLLIVDVVKVIFNTFSPCWWFSSSCWCLFSSYWWWFCWLPRRQIWSQEMYILFLKRHIIYELLWKIWFESNCSFRYLWLCSSDIWSWPNYILIHDDLDNLFVPSKTINTGCMHPQIVNDANCSSQKPLEK